MPFEYAWSVLLADCSEQELEAFLDAQKSYLKKSSQHEVCAVRVPRYVDHTMHYVVYKCNSRTCQEVCRGRDCEWYIKSVMCDLANRCAIFQHGYHVSIVMSPPRVRLNLAMKRFVREQTDARLKPSRILNEMIDTFLLDTAVDLLPRVQRYSHYYRTSKLADSNNVEDMEALVTSHRFHSNLDDKTPYAFGFATNTNGDPFLTSGTEEEPFVVGFSCNRLIRNLDHAASHVLHLDGTFKLNTCGFPVVIIGVSDVARQFHPVCFFISSDQKQHQFECILRATVNQYRIVTGQSPHLRFVMADADDAQRNAMEIIVAQVIPSSTPPVYLMCFFHVMQNVRKYIAGMSVPSRTLVFKHVYRIQYSRSREDLNARVADALEAWKGRPDCVEFARKFTKSWLSSRFTDWQCLSSPIGFAKTNNPVEQFNKQLKRDYTLRTRLNVNMLAQELLKLSRHQAARQKSFELSPRPNEDQIRRYNIMKKEGRLVVTSWYRSSVAFMVSGSNRRLFCVFQRGVDTPRQLKKQAAILDEEMRISEHLIETFEQPSSGWIVDVDKCTCQCRSWFKFSYCIHVIAARMHVGLYVEGVTKKRRFANKNKKAVVKGAIVGHALSKV